jgi:hypothetical protein
MRQMRPQGAYGVRTEVNIGHGGNANHGRCSTCGASGQSGTAVSLRTA